MSVFDINGTAALSDLLTTEWRNVFALLEGQQEDFLRNESGFRSPEYSWPRDPLHTWSRAWEYPYAYHYLEQWRREWRGDRRPRVADVGSGVTFFPFTVARLGCDVTCTDIDPICETDLVRAANVVRTGSGSMDFRFAKNGELPFAEKEVDAVYCISVLEHIPRFEETVAEIARIVRPGGLTVLTIDLDLSGNGDLSPTRHEDLLACVDTYFHPIGRRRFTPASDLLTTRTGPYPLAPSAAVSRAWFLMKESIKSFLGIQPRSACDLYLSVEGLALRRHDAIG